MGCTVKTHSKGSEESDRNKHRPFHMWIAPYFDPFSGFGEALDVALLPTLDRTPREASATICCELADDPQGRRDGST